MTDPLIDRRTIFLDTETTSLRPDRRIWDIGWIARRPGAPPEQDFEMQTFVKVPLDQADLHSLKIGQYFTRHPDGCTHRSGPFELWSEYAIAHRVFEDFTDALDIVRRIGGLE